MPIDVSAETFLDTVVRASHERPVVVDFWAGWCQPCLALAPVLEDLEREGEGKWTLAKVDTEQHPQLAAQFGITSLPTLKAFVDGRIESELVGAVSKAQLRAWVDAFTPGEETDHVRDAREAESRGDTAAAERSYEAALRAKPGFEEARLGLASLRARQGRHEEAAELVEGLDGEVAGRVRLKLRAEEAGSPEDDEPGDDSLDRLYARGVSRAAAGHQREGLEALLQVVESDPDFRDGAAREAMVEVFQALGPDSELADEYRRRLAMVLY